MAQMTLTSPEGMQYKVETPAVVSQDVILQRVRDMDQQFKSADIPPEFISQIESAGGKYNYNPKSGAKGPMQVLPKVARDPGFGVRPAKDDSVAELKRVGEEYWAAMKTKYHNTLQAAAAYNWGPTNVDQLIQEGRFHMKHLPKETQEYIKNLWRQWYNRSQKQDQPE